MHWMWGMVPQRMRAHTKTSLEKKNQSVSGIVTAVERNTVYVIMYSFFLIHMCVHLDMLNINEVIVHPQ